MTTSINEMGPVQFEGARNYFDKFITGCRKAKGEMNDTHMKAIVDSIMDFATATLIECEREFFLYSEKEAEAMEGAERIEDR